MPIAGDPEAAGDDRVRDERDREADDSVKRRPRRAATALRWSSPAVRGEVDSGKPLFTVDMLRKAAALGVHLSTPRILAS